MNKIKRDYEDVAEKVGKLNDFADDIEDCLEKCENELTDLANKDFGGLFQKLDFEEIIRELKNSHVENIRMVGESMIKNNEEFNDVDTAIEGKLK